MSVSDENPLPETLPSDKDGKHYSITQSIALENELHGVMDSEYHEFSVPPASLDPEALASIVVELRQTLTRERKYFASAMDEAASKNAASEARAADLDELLQIQRSLTQAAEARLVDAERKVVEGEQSLTMLRATLEESRRGIMRLQAESKRASLSGASNVLPAVSRANKRMSLNPSIPLPLNTTTPRNISGHRRISSFSTSDMPAGLGPRAPSPEYLVSSPSASPAPSPAVNGTFPQSGATSLLSADAELVSLRADLANTKRALAQAKEARQASEDCLRALREFMASDQSTGAAEGSQDLQGLRLPPLPSDAAIDEVDVPKPEPRKSGWGIKLWKETKETSSVATSSPAHEGVFPATSSGESVSSSTPSTHRGSFSSWTRSAGAPVTSLSSPSTQPALTPGNSCDSPREAPVTTATPTSSFRSKLGFFSVVANPIISRGNGALDTVSITSSKSSCTSSTSDNSDGPHTDDEVAQVVPSDGPVEDVRKERNIMGEI